MTACCGSAPGETAARDAAAAVEWLASKVCHLSVGWASKAMLTHESLPPAGSRDGSKTAAERRPSSSMFGKGVSKDS